MPISLQLQRNHVQIARNLRLCWALETGRTHNSDVGIVHLIAGTRPEAIKLAPLLPALREEGLEPVFVASGQHPTMVHQALSAFDLRPDVTLTVDRSSGTQAELMVALIATLEQQLAEPPEPS